MGATFIANSKEIEGKVLPFTEINEEYIAKMKIQKLLNEGHSPKNISLIWNQGNTSKCKSGINSKGVRYDSCAYSQKVLLAYNK